MKRGLIWLLLLGAAWAQPLTEQQVQGMQKAANLLEKFGDSSLAERIRADLKSGQLRVGPTPHNDNAACDTWTGVVTVKPTAVELLSEPGQQFRNTADLAVSLKHEYVHKGQGGWQFASSVARAQVGMGHPCEQQAWSSALLTYANWAQQLAGQARSTSNQTEKEKLYAQAASLAGLFETVANDYVANQATFGALTLNWQNATVGLDDLRGDMRKLKETSLSNVRQGGFWGAIRGFYEVSDGPVSLNFNINGRYVTGEFNGEVGVPAPGRTMYNCHVHGLINGSLEKGALFATLKGEMKPHSDSRIMPLTGTLAGRISDDGQSFQGVWTFSPPGSSGKTLEGRWSARR